MKIGLKPLLSIVLVAVILIPAGIVAAVGINASGSQNTEIKTVEVAAMGKAQAVGFTVLLDSCVAPLLSLSRFEEIKTAADGGYSSVRDEVDSLFKSFSGDDANPYLQSIIVANAEGNVLIDSFGNFGYMLDEIDTARNLARNDVALSEINTADNTFSVFTRIDDIGYLCMVYSTDIFTDYLKNTGFFDGDGNMFIADRNGVVLGLGDAPVTGTQIASAPLRDIVNAVTAGRDFDSGTYIGISGSVDGNSNSVKNNWYWFVTYPVASIDMLPSAVIAAGIIIAGISLVFIAVAFVLVRKVTAPPQDMFLKMRKINEGDMDERLAVSGKDEYSYISESFNEMLDEILISGKMHRTISELSDNMLFEWDFKKQTMFVSNNLLELFEIDASQATLLNGRFLDGLMEKEEAERYKIDLDKLMRNHDSMHGEYQVTMKTGSVIWVSVRAHCIVDRLNELQRIIGVITNINSEKMLSLQLSERASYDFLSGLYNRATFMRELQSEITRTATSRVGLIFIDVDDFKFINDTYGHDTGDEIIKTVANIIKDKLGSAGFAGRFGGDEFVMCVTDPNTLENIGKLATGVLELFDRGYEAVKFNVTLKIKASLGVAISPEHGRSNETLLAAADEAMYFVKKNGKCNYHIYNPEESVITELMTSI
jgi:diguanylate cyclase (GGDEF)-like protein/PAS domain S-box-containing protein